MRNIIIEGCDGSGKDTLINHLETRISFVKHSRASDSLTGPVSSLDMWVDHDLDFIEHRADMDGQIPFIYNRHPLISELIYADVRQNNPGVKGKFTNIEWILASQRRMANLSILVVCSPPFDEIERVMQAQGREAHMPGVFDNRFKIWTRYNEFVWPGTVIRYDRTRETVTDLVNTIEKLEK